MVCGWLGSGWCALVPLFIFFFFWMEKGRAAVRTSASGHAGGVSLGSWLRFFSLLGKEASLLEAHLPCCAEFGEGVHKRPLASLWAPCYDRGHSEFGLLSWLSPPFPPPPPPLFPPLSSPAEFSGFSTRAPGQLRGERELGLAPCSPLTPPALSLSAVSGTVGSRGGARTRTALGDELQTLRRGVRSIGGGVRGGGICVCV